ncbi:hypothetical protein Tco_0173773 [Tanacetum coccineum]
MADLIQDNLALEERLDKHGTRLYNLENLNIPHKVSQAVDEIVSDAVDWAMQAPLRARFRDLPTVDMKEILQQRMFEDNSYKVHDAHNDLYEALQKSLELDYSNERLADQEEARKMKKKRRESPRTPPGSPPLHPPPLPPLAGASGAPGSAQHQGRKALSSSKTAASTHQSMAWTTSDTRYESTGFTATHETSPSDDLMHDDSIPDEQVHLSNDENSENDHLPKDNVRIDWWKPLPEEERPATPEPTWIIPSFNVLDVKNNWASALVSTYEPPAENLLLAKTGDMTTFINCLLPRFRSTSFPDEGVSQDAQRSDLEYLRYGSKGSSPTLSISKMKAASYPDFGLELLVPKRIHDSSSCRKEVKTHMRILSVVRIKAYSRYGYDYLSEIVLRRADFQEHTIAEKDDKELNQGIQGQAAQSGYEYAIRDSKGRDKE